MTYQQFQNGPQPNQPPYSQAPPPGGYQQHSNTTIVAGPQPTPRIAPQQNYFEPKAQTVKKMGICILIVGIVTFLHGTIMVTVATNFWTSVAGGGIWSGIFVIIAGSLSMSAGKNPDSRGMRIGALIMLIFAMIFTLSSGFMNFVGFLVGINCDNYNNCYYDYQGNYVCNNYCEQQDSTVGGILSMVLSMFNFIAFVLSLITCVYCGRGVCCYGTTKNQGFVVAAPQHPGYGSTTVAASNYQQPSPYQPPLSTTYPQVSAPYSQQQAYNPNQPQYHPQQQYSQAPMPTSGGDQVTFGSDYQQQQHQSQEEQKVMAQDAPPAYSRNA